MPWPEGRIGHLVNPYSLEAIETALVDALVCRYLARGAEVQHFSLPQFATRVDELVRSLGL
jgi:hypothetical protein